MKTARTVLLLAMSALSSVGLTADWPAFRGPAGDGIATARNVPTHWSSTENVAWKIRLTGRNNGSPVVTGNRVFLTTANETGSRRSLECYDALSGNTHWQRDVEGPVNMPTHKTNLYGGTTPVTDGKRVVVWHSSAGLYCYDMEGKEIWQQQLGEYRHQWGYGTSPVMEGDVVLLHSGPGQKVFMAAFDKLTGKQLWATEEPVEHDGERNNANQYMGSWSTPVVITQDGGRIAVCSMATRINGYDVHTGELIWSCQGLQGERGDLAYTSPVIAKDICVAMGGYKGPVVGFRMAGKGNITEEHSLWRQDRNNPQRIGSGVYVDGFIYMANAGPNTIECLDPTIGRSRWQIRAKDGAHWGSTVCADGRLYATSQEGTTTVFEANPDRYVELSRNQLNDPGNSTPAFVDEAIFIRTFEHLYRVGPPQSANSIEDQ